MRTPKMTLIASLGALIALAGVAVIVRAAVLGEFPVGAFLLILIGGLLMLQSRMISPTGWWGRQLSAKMAVGLLLGLAAAGFGFFGAALLGQDKALVIIIGSAILGLTSYHLLKR